MIVKLPINLGLQRYINQMTLYYNINQYEILDFKVNFYTNPHKIVCVGFSSMSSDVLRKNLSKSLILKVFCEAEEVFLHNFNLQLYSCCKHYTKNSRFPRVVGGKFFRGNSHGTGNTWNLPGSAFPLLTLIFLLKFFPLDTKKKNPDLR